MIKLIVGLGNPGLEYELTRHNIGWLALDALSFESDLNWKDKFKGQYADKSFEGEKVFFLKPKTFMNLSGESVQPLCQFFKITPQEILVVYDEIDLPFGQIMFKKGGGLAGHNGLKSIAKCLGTQDFYRLRMGVSRPKHGSVSNWVLGRWSQEEMDQLSPYLDGVSKAFDLLLKNGFERAANKYSKMNFLEISDGT